MFKSLNPIYLLALTVLAVGCAGRPVLDRLQKQLTVVGSGDLASDEELTQLCAKGSTASCALLGQEVTVQQGLAIIQGATSDSRTQLAILAPRKADYLYLLLTPPDRPGEAPHVVRRLVPSQSMGRDFSKWKIEQFEVTGMAAAQKYLLWVVDDSGLIIDARELQTLDLKKRNPHIIVGSCMDDGFKVEQKRAWARINERHPDLILLLGDNAYADKYLPGGVTTADPKALWQRYVETRQSLDVYRWPRLVPIFATWDDHDYGSNDGNRTFVYKAQSEEIMHTFFPLKEDLPVWRRGPGVSGILTIYGQNFALLDDRWGRTPDGQDIPDQSHFGLEAEKWLFDNLANTTAPVWLMSGDQWYGNYHPFESYEKDHPKSFVNIKQRIRALKAPVVLVSGDRHLIEIMKIDRKEVGYPTYELTTSAIHARTYPGSLDRNPNPRRIWGAAGPYNFMEIEPETTTPAPLVLKFKVSSWGVDEGLLDRRDLVVSKHPPGKKRK